MTWLYVNLWHGAPEDENPAHHTDEYAKAEMEGLSREPEYEVILWSEGIFVCRWRNGDSVHIFINEDLTLPLRRS